MEQRGRGRARGRSRQQDQGQPQPGGAGPRPYPQGAPPRGAWGAPQAWGPRPGAQQPFRGGPPQQQMQQQRQQPPPQQQQQEYEPPSVGRAHHRGAMADAGPSTGGVSTVSGTAAGDGNGSGAHSGRGMHRGKRDLHDVVLRTRPDHVATKKGTTGRTVQLRANYFTLIQQTTNWCLYQYRVDFVPEEDHTGKRKGMFRTAVASLNLSGYLFDGTVMYTPHRINPSPMELFVDSADGGGEKVRITIRLVGDVVQGDYHYLQIFNIIMRKCMSFLKLQLVGRNFFDAHAKITIAEHNLELWPGYVTSIRQHENSILMCCEIAHKVMRNETVLQLLMECTREDRGDYKRRFTESIIGKVVLTDYNNKTYRIDDVNFDLTPMSTFDKKDGTKISYMDYYRQRYGLNITNPKQPLLLSIAKPRELRAGMSEAILLIPELCRMTGLTDNQRAQFQLMQALAEHTRVGPKERIEMLHRFSRRLTSNPQVAEELKQWNLPLANNIIEFSGRVLPPEKLMGGGCEYSAGPRVDWTSHLQSKKMFDSVAVTDWSIIFPYKVKSSLMKFLQMLKRASEGMYWSLGQPKMFEINDDRIGSYLQAIDSVADKPELQLIMFIVMNNKGDRYSALKKKCCVDKAIPTQVIVAKNLDNKRSMSIATKVAIQMNCKVGGAPWTVNIPLKKMMVVGYDVCHDPTNRNRSFGAMVASLNSTFTRYFSCSSAHTSGEELSNDFALNMVKAVKEFQAKNGYIPDQILIFRDGVGDGQLNFVIEHEVEAIKRVLGEFYKDKPLKLAFIVVSKRINTRIFTGSNNPDPGTVIDDVITLPERYDYYIVSQCTRQGTVSPTSYNILYDSLGLSADRLQILTYKMTHMYYNWSGTVRVPAPCQYAHKLAFMVAQSLHRSPNPGLQTLLYFL